ncbi:MAG: TrkH family potassium uptake protein [Trueperaceae bacterium]|nr:TrkH family potassium uptake protein [Trueperaceae bacterium]
MVDRDGALGTTTSPGPRGPSGRGRTAPLVIGTVLAAIGLMLTVFGAFAALLGEPTAGYVVGVVVGIGSGLALRAWGRPGSPENRRGEPTRREALVALLASWALVPALGALPFVGAGVLGPLDAYFEAMSGFTTTGATMITDFSAVGPVLFMWRAFTQWVGGIGIIVLFVGLFPQLAIAGRQLFFAEAPGPTEERLTPRLRHTAFALLSVYGALTVACAIAYDLAGMRTYDAVAHALTTMSAGGFSPHGRSFEVFAPVLMWVAVVFMFFAGSNFALLYRGLAGRTWAILRDVELRSYLAVAAVVTVAVAVVLGLDGLPAADAWRHGAFQTMSILTSTGYASADFGVWSERSQALLLLVAFIGGSAGSAAGGVKVARWVILVQHTSREVRRTMHPRAVLPVRMGGRVVPEDVQRSVAAFITLYLSLFALSTVALVLLGEDFTTAFSAAIACLGNIGPGLAAVGPMENFAGLHPAAKGVLIFCMYAGRLEVVTVFALVTRAWWRRPRYDRGFPG